MNIWDVTKCLYVHFCNSSLALVIPNGISTKRYRPKGVLKLHNFELSSSNSTCQYESFWSRMVNSRAPPNCVLTSVNVGIWKCSLQIVLFSCFGSKHIRRDPSRFSVITRLLDQSVGSSTYVMTPCSSNFFSFSRRGSCSACGTRLRGSTTGCAPGFSSM